MLMLLTLLVLYSQFGLLFVHLHVLFWFAWV